MNIKRILCPTDLSSESDEALRYAVALTRAYDARLVLLYCRRPSSVVEWVNRSRARPLFKQALFTHLDADDLKLIDWEGIVAEGDDAGLTIIEEATRKQADLIVMRSRRRPHAAALLGSTAETVSRRAPCPVLVTHPQEREFVGLSAGDIDLHRVLVAHDFSPDAELAASYALALAEEYQAEVHMLHVISHRERQEPEVAWSHVGLDNLYTGSVRRLHDAVPKQLLRRCDVSNVVRRGQPAEKIVAYARTNEIDLICVGASGAGLSLGTLFGSTVDHVLRRAPCPVWVARPVKPAVASSKVA